MLGTRRPGCCSPDATVLLLLSGNRLQDAPGRACSWLPPSLRHRGLSS